MCIYVYIKINRHTYVYMTQSAKRLTPDADAADRGLQSWTMWEYKTFCTRTRAGCSVRTEQDNRPRGSKQR